MKVEMFFATVALASPAMGVFWDHPLSLALVATFALAICLGTIVYAVLMHCFGERKDIRTRID